MNVSSCNNCITNFNGCAYCFNSFFSIRRIDL
ncbi:MAG: hypothetical protein GQ574_16020 [Crocinitomix sp.]|nr:hypothetical protein [Crocinitomix sp.]